MVALGLCKIADRNNTEGGHTSMTSVRVVAVDGVTSLGRTTQSWRRVTSPDNRHLFLLHSDWLQRNHVAVTSCNGHL